MSSASHISVMPSESASSAPIGSRACGFTLLQDTGKHEVLNHTQTPVCQQVFESAEPQYGHTGGDQQSLRDNAVKSCRYLMGTATQ